MLNINLIYEFFMNKIINNRSFQVLFDSSNNCKTLLTDHLDILKNKIFGFFKIL